MPSIHLRIAGLTLVLLVLWGISAWRSDEQWKETAGIDIAIEHADTAAVTLVRTTDGRGLIDIRNEAQTPIAVSLPEDWKRDEVRGVPLASVTGGDPSLGYRRWSIGIAGSVSFRVPSTWDSANIRNISNEPLRLQLVTVDLERDTSDSESYLMDAHSELHIP